MRVSEDLRPLTDLKVGAGELVRQVESTGRPMVLTRHGRGVAVLLSLAAFEELQDRLADSELRRALHDAESDVLAGRTVSQGDIEVKYLGGVLRD